jgi:hypothetical protein
MLSNESIFLSFQFEGDQPVIALNHKKIIRGFNSPGIVCILYVVNIIVELLC